MNYDSTTPLPLNPFAFQANVFFPFTVYLRVVAAVDGRRDTMLIDLAKKARFIEYELVNSGWNIARPVAFKPRFGDRSALITITGFIERLSSQDPNVPATTPVQEFDTGNVPGDHTQLITGDVGGGNLSWDQQPTAQTNDLVADLINAMKVDSSTISNYAYFENVMFNGVNYGRGARSFPE